MKKENKYKLHDFNPKIHLLITFMFISSKILLFHQFSLFGNEEKLVALLV